MIRLSKERELMIRGKNYSFDVNSIINELWCEIDALRKDLAEENRINGMGAQRELKLETQVKQLERWKTDASRSLELMTLVIEEYAKRDKK